MYMDCVGAVLVAGAILFVLEAHSKGEIENHVAALAVTYAMQIQSVFMWLIKNYNSMELAMVCVERMDAYIHNPQESKGTVTPPPNWPASGKLVFEKVRFRYLEDGPIVLGTKGDGIDLELRSGERVAFVGRTGAGKSTVGAALFQLSTIASGRILLDGVDIASVDPRRARQQIALVAQEPQLFSESVRMNLDPSGEHSDAELWRVLEQTRIREKVSSLPEGLDTRLAQGAENLSLGEKQLLCMARAVLRGSRVLLLDEATASIDIHADKIIQDTIRKLENVTILTVAHRISTILDYDRVVVLEDGNVVEIGPPDVLGADPSSRFFRLKQGGA